MQLALQDNKIVSMNTLEIAEAVGKEHKHVTRDVEVIQEKLDATKFGLISEYKDSLNRNQKIYILNKDEILTLVSGYDAGLRFAIVKKLSELESQICKPQTKKEWILEALRQEEEVERLALENKDLKEELDHSLDYVSILKVAMHNKISENSFNWRLLKAKSIELDYPVKKVISARYGYQNLYSVIVFKRVYPSYNYSFEKILSIA
jgi:phage regulator Rha-like protein